MTDKCMCPYSSPYLCHYCVDRMKEKLGFCPHNEPDADPAWCDKKCEKEGKEEFNRES